MNTLISQSTKHLTDIVKDAILLQSTEHACYFDTIAPLTKIVRRDTAMFLKKSQFRT